ncbi:uncharacterized protein LOC115182866 [Salmo trutta]|uniref:uncharacterized protein LOC115182866 n=1 Tax=Salmo trutta TaxID=8032 RepID=UPI0011309C4A|nr:uncharacterized protein LOC115182866 [Salmo trutta]
MNIFLVEVGAHPSAFRQKISKSLRLVTSTVRTIPACHSPSTLSPNLQSLGPDCDSGAQFALQGPEMESVKLEDCSQTLELNVNIKEEEEEEIVSTWSPFSTSREQQQEDHRAKRSHHCPHSPLSETTCSTLPQLEMDSRLGLIKTNSRARRGEMTGGLPATTELLYFIHCRSASITTSIFKGTWYLVSGQGNLRFRVLNGYKVGGGAAPHCQNLINDFQTQTHFRK